MLLVATLFGLLQPAFVIATGSVVQIALSADQSMGDRIMREISRQPGLEEVEDPRVRACLVEGETARADGWSRHSRAEDARRERA